MGEAFGDSGLKELISIKDYLDSPPIIDEFLDGVIVGMRRAAERKARILKDQQRKHQNGAMPSDVNKLMQDKGV